MNAANIAAARNPVNGPIPSVELVNEIQQTLYREARLMDYERYERLIPMYSDRNQLSLFPELENYSGAQAVLVGAESFKSIRESYPNYSLDTKVFVDKVARFVVKHRRSA